MTTDAELALETLQNQLKFQEAANKDLCDDLDEATDIIKQLARLIAGWEHVPAMPADLQERAEAFGADFSG